MKKQEFLKINPSSFYMVVNGKLTYLNVKKIEYRRDAETSTWLGTIYAEDVDSNKVTIKQDWFKGMPKRYYTVDGFEHDDTSLNDESCLLFTVRFRNAGNARVNDDGFLQYWVMKNGNPTFVSRPIDRFYMTYNGDFWEFVLSDDIVPPANSYSTREDLLSWSEWIEKGKDGKEKVHRGINKLIMLDDDQRELVEQFKNLLNQMRKKQISIIMSFCDEVKAFNTRKLKNWAMATCPDDLIQTSDCGCDLGKCKTANINADAFDAGSIPVWGEDYDLYAIPKDEENKDADEATK